MILFPLSVRGPFSKSFLSHFPREFKLHFTAKPSQTSQKFLNRNLSRPKFACYAFDEIPVQETDRSLKEVEFLNLMEVRGIRPNCQTYLWLLDLCLDSGSLVGCKKLHGKILKVGFDIESVLCDKLIDAYFALDDLDGAAKVFDVMLDATVATWNKILSGFINKKESNKALHLFLRMMKGLIPNQFTYPIILSTCTSSGAIDLGEQIHTQTIKTGFHFDRYVCSALIDMYAKLGKLEIARGILNRLPEKDVISWTALIAGYTQHDLFVEALKLFEEMQSQGIQSDTIGFSSAISACAGIQALNQGKQIHAQSYISGFVENLSIGNALVSLYAKCGKRDEAYLAFEKIDAKDIISWNGLISGFAQSGYCEEAMKVFRQLNRSGLKASFATFGSGVSAAAILANIKQGEQIHAMILKSGFNADIEVSNALISMYAKCGSIEGAKNEFFEMPVKNEVSWNAMITAQSQHGCGAEAIRLFEKMKQVGEMPTHVTFIGVLTACSHVGMVNVGLGYFDSMIKEHGLVPKPEHYVCVVDLLSRAGFLGRTRKFIEEMAIKPDAMVWRTLLSACTYHKNIEIGEYAAHRLLQLEPEDSATYVLLSNLYAITGKWNYRDQTRKLMKYRGVKKEPGRSWIEVKNSVHAFYVGDQLHPLAHKIYECLADLNKRAVEIGYIQDRYSLFNDLEQEQKDPTIYIHSEKLAIAFGLISSSHTVPIRIMKNLRVCKDCHTWTKFVSKISKREIVVRDAYRFHHFAGGVCSCGDYW